MAGGRVLRCFAGRSVPHRDLEVHGGDARTVFAGGAGVEHLLGHAPPEGFRAFDVDVCVEVDAFVSGKPDVNYYDSSWNQLGSVDESHYGLDGSYADWATINTNSSEAWLSVVNRYGQDDQAIETVGNPADLPQGAQVCKSGVTTQVTCGDVVSNDADMTETDGTPLRDQILTKVTVANGDSGGPLYLGDTGFGIIHGGASFSDGTSGSYSQPLKPIMDYKKLVLNPA